MGEIIVSIVETAILSEAASHPEEVLDIAADVVCGAGECVCDVLDGLGSLFD